jgi:glycosyltransferase involved in cell wall biosynthesis
MNKKLHILFLTHWFPSKNFPRGGNFILRHAQAAATLHEVTVLFVERNNSSAYEIIEENENGLKIIYVYYKSSSWRIINYLNKCKAYKIGLKRVGNFDLIHLNVLHYYAFIAVYFKIFKKINFVITEHWTRWLAESQSLSDKFYHWMMRLVCSYSSYILPVSNNLADKMKEKGIKGNFKVIPNVVNTEVFSGREKNEEEIMFLHISNLKDSQKNFSGILYVTKKLIEEGYNFILNIGGDGDISPIQRFCKENSMEKNISIFGDLTEDEVSQKMKEADVFILFSNTENQPCVINESFSGGLPVIATRVGGISEFFPPDFGILIEKGNEEELYEAMKACLTNKIKFASPEIMHQYAENTFSVRVIAKEFDTVYRKTLES